MYIYILEILIISLLGLWLQNTKRKNADAIFCILSFAIIISIGALRKYTVGIDLATQYAKSYSIICEMHWNDLHLLRYEYGYSTFCKLLSYISKDPQFYIFATSLICYGSVGLFIFKNSEDVCLSTLLFITCNYMFIYMNVIRQALAVAIILFGIDYIKRKQYLRFAVVILLASSFHTSALIAFLMIALSIIGYKRQLLVFSIGFYIASLLFGKQFYRISSGFLGKYEGYADKGNFGEAIINSYTVVNSLIMIIVFLLANKYIFRKNDTTRINPFDENSSETTRNSNARKITEKKRQPIAAAFEEEYLMNMMLFLAVFQSSVMSMQILSRLRIIFHPYLLVVMPQIVERFPNKKIIKVWVYLFALAYFIYTARYTSSRNYGTIPYEFFWQ